MIEHQFEREGLITETAQRVLEERYFLEGESRWSDVVERVAKCFGNTEDEVNSFREMLINLDAIPNSPTLMNAGTDIKSYSACYVLPIDDSTKSIFKYYTDAGLISKSGGGVGANFSNIRHRGATVQSTGGVASGPISFMKGQDALTDVIKQGGRRRGANMGILNVDHPDIMDFIRVKDEPNVLTNFNLSVNLTDSFMRSITDSSSDSSEKFREIWGEIIRRAWSSAEPGVLFGDTAERFNTVPHLGKLDTTNPCGEQWLLPYESCTLGSINLSNHVLTDSLVVDWAKLKKTTHGITLLLNRVLDKSEFSVPECQEAMELTRKIGVGIMGLHDMLIQLGIPYDSEEGRSIASRVMAFIYIEADEYSKLLGAQQGTYEGYVVGSPARRNANLTTIAPTGTLSMIANCSSGCEPYYAPIVYKTVLDGTTFEMPNKWVKRQMDAEGVTKFSELSDKSKALFKGAEDIHWRDHVLMQGALQESVDSSISKTINMPNSATTDDVEAAYKLAWNLGCKGITIYRDGSRDAQVLSTKSMSTIANDTIIVDHPPIPYKMDLPDELESRRYRIRDEKNQKVYFNVCTVDDQPVEVFAKGSEEVSGSYWNTICRLLSLCMRYNIPLDDIKKQLRKSSDSVSDMPSRLARILDKYDIPEDSIHRTSSNMCQECGGTLTPEGGCEYCKVCGWSKCL